MTVYGENKRTGEIVELEKGLTPEQAEKFAEEWGWSYSDGNGNDFYIMLDMISLSRIVAAAL